MLNDPQATPEDRSSESSSQRVVAAAKVGEYREVAEQKYRGKGFTLASLFLLMTTCATLIALWRPLVTAFRQGNVSGQLIVTASLVSGSICVFFGIIVGLTQRRPGIGVIMGIVTGGALGLLLGPLVLVPDELVGSLLRSSLFGSIAILVVAIALRRL